MSAILDLWTIYERPKDYPEGYVARRFEVGVGVHSPTNQIITADSLDEIRELLLDAHPGLYRIPRSPEDEPQIVEVWV